MSATGLTLRPFYWRATELFPEKEIVSRTSGGTSRWTYAEFGDRAAALADSLSRLGVGTGDRVGTIAWNTHRHLEAFFGVPMMGAQLHTVNANLGEEKIAYVIEDADDDVLVVDPGEPLSLIERLWPDLDGVDHVVVLDDSVPETDIDSDAVHSYERLIEEGRTDFEWPDVDEDRPAGMCYTSGSTGEPKGAEYSHKMIYAHAMMLMTPAAADVRESDVVMPVVPMFHVNSWMLPYATTAAGTKQVYPGPNPDAETLARLINEEEVTVTHGVPTVWIDLLNYLDAEDVELPSLERIVTGGFAPPGDLLRRFDERGIQVEHTWGMTETMSLACASRPKSTMDDWSDERRFDKRVKQGLLTPGYEMKVIDESGEEIPWDGNAYGELLVRGPTVIDEYYNCPDANEADFEDGWLKTGDVVTVDEDGYLNIVDRKKDMINSGGEWISSIELENNLMDHDAVVEAAVVSVPHDKWHERPLACVKTRSDTDVSAAELRDFLSDEHPRWWLPDDVIFVNEVPKNSTGKFDKQRLSYEFSDHSLPWTPGQRS